MSITSQVSNGQARCTRIALCNAAGEPCNNFRQGDTAIFYYEFELIDDIGVPICGLNISNERGIIVYGKNSWQFSESVPTNLKAKTILLCKQEIELKLGPGEYILDVHSNNFYAIYIKSARYNIMEKFDNMIFISGRFRSGTTVLWHIFRSVPQICAYNEPLHDNLLAYITAEMPIDPTHKGVSDYWAEYRHIVQDVAKMHKREFGVTRLCLNQNEEYPELQDYLKFLADSAGHKIPLFKFVRADYRLPWLKKTFPKAKIISTRRYRESNIPS